MKATYIKAALIFFIALPGLGNAALITNINDLEILGIKYDVSFHPGKSFNELFDPDGDGTFGEGDSALIDRAPFFFGAERDAAVAAEAIINHLGQVDHTHTASTNNLADYFHVPYSALGTTLISTYTDRAPRTHQDISGTGIIAKNRDTGVPIATFRASTVTSVPEPSTIALAVLAAGMIGVSGFRRRVR